MTLETMNAEAKLSARQRREARSLALQALCLYDALGDAFAAELNRFLADAAGVEDLGHSDPPEEGVIQLARLLANAAWANRAATDVLLERHVTDWSIPRMPPVDRNVLRLGLYELMQTPQTPAAVVLNEAIELARRFGSAESPAFVNGVLDGIRKVLAAPGGEDRPSEPAGPQEGDRAATQAIEATARPAHEH